MEQREKLIELIREHNEVCGDCAVGYCSDPHYDECLADRILASGVVVLPCRCRDCYYNDNESHDEIIWCNLHDAAMGIDGFCVRAKRKGGDE